ncbi:MAG: hypothetical protein ACP5PB_02000 [Acidimicrobiales bacterium]
MTVALTLSGVAVATGEGAVASAAPTTTTKASAALKKFDSCLKAHGVSAVAFHPGTFPKKGTKPPTVKKGTKPSTRYPGRSSFFTNPTMRKAFLACSRLAPRRT